MNTQAHHARQCTSEPRKRHFEERDLVAKVDSRYHDYRDRGAMIVPFTATAKR